MADMDVTAKFRADISDMKSKMDQMTRSIDGMQKATTNASGGFSIMKNAIGTAFGGAIIGGIYAAGRALSGLATSSIAAASGLEETSSKVNQIFGPQSAAQIESWAATASSAFGQSKQQAMDAASTFAIFGKGAGLQGEALTGFSQELTVLASDLASFANTTPDDAIVALGAALRGESEPIRRYGVLLDDASLKAEYMAQTGEKVTGSLTPQQRVLAAHALIMKQTADAQGDFARTSDGLANSQRTLTAVIADTKAQVGEALLPAVTSITQALGPLVQQLAGPLGQVASQIGGVLTQAFTALTPILPTLANALGTIATTIGSSLVGVLQTLIPVLQPILKSFSELAVQIAPLLEKVMGKVAEILGRVLQAVTPLLQPLMELVMGILNAAWPIIEIVADALLMLVDALAPVLDAVVVLLKPLGDLIKVVLAAMLPILKPILPVIQALAQVLGQVLVKAVGLIMAGLGGLIIGLSKIAPFVLNNVAKPVIKHFLNMAKGVVGAASNMLGWVPGLGDSLKAAEAAIGEFAVQTEKSIGQAADTIATEGSRIGNEMITQGQAALNAAGPALGASARGLGNYVASQYSDAVSRGIKPPAAAGVAPPPPPPTPAPTPSGTGSGSKEANEQEKKRLAQIEKFVEGFKAAIERIKEGQKALADSTKRAGSEFAKALGDMLPKSAIQEAFGPSGTIDTVISQYDQLDAAINDLYKPLMNMKRFGKAAAEAARSNMQSAKSFLKSATEQGLALMRARELNIKALEQAETDYTNAVNGINAQYDELDRAAAASLRATEQRWDSTIKSLEDALDKANQAFERENEILQGLIKERDTFLGRISDGFRSFVNDLKIDFEGADGGGAAIEKALNDRLQKIRNFSTNIRTLMQKGVDPSLVREFVSAGVAGAGDFVAQLATASAEEIASINAAQTALASEVASFQTYAAQQWFNAGIAQQEAIVAPLAAARDQAQAALLAANAARTAEIAAAQAHIETLRVQRQAALDAAKAQYDAQKAALIQQGVEIDTALTNNANNLHAGIANLQNTVPPEMFKAGKKSVNRMLDGFEKKFPGMKAELNRMMDDLAASMNRTATVTITTVHRSVFESVGPEHRALGGPIRAGQAYIVGERGPELFVSNAAGNIIPNNDLGSLMRRPMGDGMGGGQSVNIAPGAVQINVNGSMDARSKQEIEAVVDEALLRLAREIRRT